MWNPFEKHRLKKDWRLVSTQEAYFTYVDEDGNALDKKDRLFFYLYENGLGERKCESGGMGEYSGNSNYQIERRNTHSYYLRNIRPWLAGQFDPEIPNYESIKSKEFKDALAGKVT